MHILDRFSTHLRDCLARSIQMASELKNPLVEPVHLLFTLSNQKGSVATEILNRFKLSAKTLEQALLNLPTIAENALSAPGGATPQTLTPLSPGSKVCLEKAMVVAQENNHNYIGTEHLLVALVRINDLLVDDVFKVNGVKISELQKQLDAVLSNAAQFPRITEVAEVVERIQENMGEMMGGEGAEPHQHPAVETKKRRKKESALEFFATHLTSREAQKNIDPVVGRDKEIERVIQILCRRTKNNPLLLGEPGVGKTAIVEGLAKRIMEGAVPDMLLTKKIYALDMGLLIAGTIYRGEFEGRLRQVIEEVSHDPNIIIFIDEIHNIVGAGSNQGTMDAANILKPALSRGLIRCIGATTPAENKKYIENDAALERRFQSVSVKEPSVLETIEVLKGVAPNYESFHQVTIDPEALEAAAKLSDRYIVSKFLPDKAIDLLDETAAAKRLSAKGSSFTNKLVRFQRSLEEITLAKEQAASEDKFQEAVKLKKEEEEMKKQIKEFQALIKSKKPKRLGTVTARDVAEQVAKMIGTDPSELILDDVSSLTGLENELSRYVVGQEEAIHEVSDLIRQAQLGLSNPDRPLTSCLLVGESGVGKTELAKSLALVLYKDKDALIKLDMSEFNEAFGVSKLLGSPAGYIGYKENNQFTDKLKLHPYSVVLLDEIDKAHKDVRRLLLQMLENGEITDSTGKKISLRHAIIILTTSFGADELTKGALGFGSAAVRGPEAKKRVVEKLKEYFSPELINRLDKICFFNPLGKSELVKIAELEINRLNGRLQAYNTAVKSTASLEEWIKEQMSKSAMSARDIRRLVRSDVEKLFAEIILKERVKKHYELTIKNRSLTLR